MVKELRYRLEYLVYVSAQALVRTLPHGAAKAFAPALGYLGYAAAGSARRTTRENLQRVFPDWSPIQRARVGRRCFGHFARVALDSLSMGRLDPVELCRRVSLEGWHHLDEAEADGRGLMTLSGHVGQWEIVWQVLGLYCSPLHGVVRPFPNPLTWKMMAAERERFGQYLIPRQGAARRVFSVLRDGGRVGLLIDQRVRPGQGGIPVPLLGHDALTTSLPAAAALRLGTPAAWFFGHFEPGGRYRIVCHPPIRPEGDPKNPADVAALTRRYIEVLDRQILSAPEQWLWMHRRWRPA